MNFCLFFCLSVLCFADETSKLLPGSPETPPLQEVSEADKNAPASLSSPSESGQNPETASENLTANKVVFGLDLKSGKILRCNNGGGCKVFKNESSLQNADYELPDGEIVIEQGSFAQIAKVEGYKAITYSRELAGKEALRSICTMGLVRESDLKPFDPADPQFKKDIPAEFEITNVPAYAQDLEDSHRDASTRAGYAGWKPDGYCGPTSVQMILEFNGTKMARDKIARTSVISGDIVLDVKKANCGQEFFYFYDNGSCRQNFEAVLRKLDFKATNIKTGASLQDLKSTIKNSRPALVNLKGSTKAPIKSLTDAYVYKASGGHYMVAVGYSAKNDIIVLDPYPWSEKGLDAEKRPPVKRVIPADNFLRAWKAGGAMIGDIR